MRQFDIDTESETQGRAQDRAIQRMASGEFDIADVRDSLFNLPANKHDGLLKALQDNDNAEIGRLVNNAVFYYLTEKEMTHEEI